MSALTVYALIALGLLLDGAYLFRIALFCCAVHEAGHVATYIICAHSLPKLELSAGGICLKRTALLSRNKRLFVLCMGPAFNFLLSAALYFKAQQNATYSAYIIAAVSLCVGLYNMLPIGALDGAQIVETFISGKHIMQWNKLQNVLVIALCFVLPAVALFFKLPLITCVAAFVAPVYLFIQNKF